MTKKKRYLVDGEFRANINVIIIAVLIKKQFFI